MMDVLFAACGLCVSCCDVYSYMLGVREDEIFLNFVHFLEVGC